MGSLKVALHRRVHPCAMQTLAKRAVWASFNNTILYTFLLIESTIHSQLKLCLLNIRPVRLLGGHKSLISIEDGDKSRMSQFADCGTKKLMSGCWRRNRRGTLSMFSGAGTA